MLFNSFYRSVSRSNDTSCETSNIKPISIRNLNLFMETNIFVSVLECIEEQRENVRLCADVGLMYDCYVRKWSELLYDGIELLC